PSGACRRIWGAAAQVAIQRSCASAIWINARVVSMTTIKCRNFIWPPDVQEFRSRIILLERISIMKSYRQELTFETKTRRVHQHHARGGSSRQEEWLKEGLRLVNPVMGTDLLWRV